MVCLAGQSEAVKDYFNSIDDYDTCADHVVPWNEEIQNSVYSGALDYLGVPAERLASGLDLGIGTAHDASIFLANNPGARVVGVDFSEKMLVKAKENLGSGGLLERVELLNKDFAGWFIPERKFDVCFSAIAIHNATDEGKQALFRKIYPGLTPGGVFVNGDFVRSESEHGDRAWRAFYEEHLRKYLSGKELGAWVRHAFTEDKPARLSEQKEWLLRAGFSEFGVVWQKCNLAVYFAKK